mmetsp:Transcript_4992/g.4923  ORF Transcript_4992/g.4923 Transcript_4992/m.4923 type:complete len:116 (+) Transcript_4992:193-540(+)
MEPATNLQKTRGTADVLFEKGFIPFIQKKNGIITIKDYKNIPDTQNAGMNSLYKSGNFSQECSGDTDNTPVGKNNHVMMTGTSNRYVTWNAKLRNIAELMKGNNEAENEFDTNFS